MYRLESEAIDDRRWITGVMILLYNTRWMPGWESWGVSSRSFRTSSTRVRMIWRYHIQIDMFRISNITHGHTNIRKKAFLIYWKDLSYKCKVGIKIPVKNVTPHCLQKIQTNTGSTGTRYLSDYSHRVITFIWWTQSRNWLQFVGIASSLVNNEM